MSGRPSSPSARTACSSIFSATGDHRLRSASATPGASSATSVTSSRTPPVVSSHSRASPTTSALANSPEPTTATRVSAAGPPSASRRRRTSRTARACAAMTSSVKKSTPGSAQLRCRAVAFRDIAPKAPVHVLVVPREHYPDVSALAASAPEVLADVVALADGVASDLADGQYRLVFNTGPKAGPAVFHVPAHRLAGGQLPGLG